MNLRNLLLPTLLFSLLTVKAQDSLFYQNVEWSPDGSRLCTQGTRKSASNFSPNSYIINITEGKIERKIEGATFPVWSPDGRFIAYTRQNNTPHGADIWLLNVASGLSQMIHGDTSRTAGLTFSPDGKKICFSSARDPKRNLYLVNTDGTGIERITFDAVAYFNPVWSPKGDKVLYYRERGDSRDKVCAMDIRTKTEVKLTDDTLHNYYPCWFPSGKAICYTSSDPHGRTPDSRQIVFFDLDKMQGHYIAGLEGAFFAKVSSDGQKIAFVKGPWPHSDIFISAIDGKNAKCITCRLSPQ